MSIQIEEGKFYRTRAGRKAGPMCEVQIMGWKGVRDGNGHLFQMNGVHGDADDLDAVVPNQPDYDLIAEWTDSDETASKELYPFTEVAWTPEEGLTSRKVPLREVLVENGEGSFTEVVGAPFTMGIDDTNPKDAIGRSKLSFTKVPFIAIAHCAKAMMDGANKYGPYNWRNKKVSAGAYIDAAQRHIAAWYEGQQNAGDSGAHHLGHAMACLAILLDAEEHKCLVDDRPKVIDESQLARRLAELAEKRPS